MFPPTAAYGIVIGTGLGYLGATGIDAAMRCDEEVEDKPMAMKSNGRAAPLLAILPIADKTRFGLALVGQF
jgi:hypothetical protein